MDGVLDEAGEVQEHLSSLLEPPDGQPLFTIHCRHSRPVSMLPAERSLLGVCPGYEPSAMWDCAGVDLLASPLPLLAVSKPLQREPRHAALW